jgi:hypothetical protein
MPAGKAVLQLDFRQQIQQIRKSFGEMKKMQTQHQRRADKQLKVEKKFQSDEIKTMKKKLGMEDRAFTKQIQRQRRLRDERGRYLAKEKRERDSQGRFLSRERRKQKDHARGMNRELKRGPLGRMMGKVGRGAAFAGGGMMGLLLGAMFKGYANYLQAQQSFGPLIGMGGGTSAMRLANQMPSTPGRKRDNLGYNVMERAQMAAAMGRATGSVSPGAMMLASRATGMNTGELSGVFGAMREAGTRFSGPGTVMGAGGKEQLTIFKGTGRREFTRILAAGMYSGLEKARLPDFATGVAQMTRQFGMTRGGRVDTQGFASLMGAFGRFGGVGFQGGRGMNVAGKLHQAFMQPGAGPEGMAIMRQAMGYGRPGGGTSFYQAEKMRERGLSDPKNFARLMDFMKQTVPDQRARALELRGLVPGLSLEQAEGLMKIHESSASMEDKMADVQNIMDKAKPLQERAAEAMEKAATALRRIAGRFDTSVGIGAKSAKLIQQVEDLQMKLVKLLIKWIPKIGAMLEKIWEAVKPIAEILMKGLGVIAKGVGEAISWGQEKAYQGITKVLGGHGRVKSIDKKTTEAARLWDEALRIEKSDPKKAAELRAKASKLTAKAQDQYVGEYKKADRRPWDTGHGRKIALGGQLEDSAEASRINFFRKRYIDLVGNTPASREASKRIARVASSMSEQGTAMHKGTAYVMHMASLAQPEDLLKLQQRGDKSKYGSATALHASELMGPAGSGALYSDDPSTVQRRFREARKHIRAGGSLETAGLPADPYAAQREEFWQDKLGVDVEVRIKNDEPGDNNPPATKVQKGRKDSAGKGQ